MSRRLALVIGNSLYDDTTLAQLKTPDADVHTLATALRDPQVGGFDDVLEMVNQPEASVRRAISQFFLQKRTDDLLLLYFSGHGVLDAQGRLFLAVKDTQRHLLNATAIPSSFISDDMDSCRSKRQILILDCCHSGAFAKGAKGDAPAITRTTFKGNGFGRVVLTASDSTQYALEGDRVVKQASLSLFTHYLLEGLTTGEADSAQDGWITLDEWYDYAYDRVVNETPDQTPRKWAYNQQGDLVIARNPNPQRLQPADLPDELKLAVQSPFVAVRAEAVEELKRQLSGATPARTRAAYQALKNLAEQDDSRRIAGAAERILAEYDQAHPGEGGLPTETGMPPVRREEIEEAARLAQALAEGDLAASTKAEASQQAEVERLAAQKVEAASLDQEKPAWRRKTPAWITILALAALIVTGLMISLRPRFLSPRATAQTDLANTPAAKGAALPDLGGRTITVAVSNDYPPYSYVDKASAERVGWDYDVVREICKRLSCVPQFKTANWYDIFEGKNAGEYDLLADGVVVGEELRQRVDFSIPYSTVSLVLVARADEPAQNVFEFQADPEKIVAVRKASIEERLALAAFPDDKVEGFGSIEAATQAVISGLADGVVIDDVSVQAIMRENEGKLTALGQLTTDQQLAFAFAPGSPLVEAVDAALAAMKADGTLEALNKQWGLSQ